MAGRRYTFLRNADTLSHEQLGYLAAQLQRTHTLKTVRAFHLTLVFLEVFAQPATYLRRWRRWARDNGLPEMHRVAETIRTHWHGVLRWFTPLISSGVLEGLNSLIQAAKAKARDYRTGGNLITMAYLIAGQLRLRNRLRPKALTFGIHGYKAAISPWAPAVSAWR